MKNLASIIIPYNKNRGYLQAAIESCERNGVEPILECSPNSVGYNVNAGLRKVQTKYFCILAEDDILPDCSIRSRVEFMERTNSGFMHSRGIQLNGSARTPVIWTKPNASFEGMLRTNQICGGTTMYKTELVDLFGGWDEQLWTSEEYEWHLRLLAGGVRLDFLDKVTYIWRRHDLQKSIGNKSGEYQTKRFKVKHEIINRYL